MGALKYEQQSIRGYSKKYRASIMSLRHFSKLHDAYVADFEGNEYRILQGIPDQAAIYKNKAMNMTTREAISFTKLYSIARNVRNKNNMIIAKRTRSGMPLRRLAEPVLIHTRRKYTVEKVSTNYDEWWKGK